jgi:hypothetical protein
MYGPLMYFGPIDPAELPIGFCECGQSEEDCSGDCYQNGLLQLTDPVTGEHPLSIHAEEEDFRIARIEAERALRGKL